VARTDASVPSFPLDDENAIEIAHVHATPLDTERLRGFSIDLPMQASWVDGRYLSISGWVLPVRAPAVAIEITLDGEVIARAPVERHRPDLAIAFPDIPAAANAGFSLVAIVPPGGRLDGDLTVEAVLAGEDRAPLARIATVPFARERVSVVITCHDKAHLLPEAIESALSQTYPDVEVIVVDDGSADNTPAVAARYPGVLYVHPRARGLAAARDAGWRASTGVYLLFVEATERLLPHAAQAGAAALRAHGDRALAAGRWCPIGADGHGVLTAAQPATPGADASGSLVITRVSAVAVRHTHAGTLFDEQPRLSAKETVAHQHVVAEHRDDRVSTATAAAIVDIVDVRQSPHTGELAGAAIDLPTPVAGVPAGALDLAGWVLGRTVRAVGVELVTDDARILTSAAVELARPDVAAAFPQAQGAATSGFRTTAALWSVSSAFELVVRAVLSDGRRVAVGTIRGQRRWREPADAGYAALASVVVIPDGVRHLDGVIESVLSQTYRHVEVLVIADGSNGGGASITSAYAGVGLVRLETQTPSAARNAGLQSTNGNYVVFVDGNCPLRPGALEAGIEALRAHPAWGFSSGRWSGNRDVADTVTIYRRAVFELVGHFDESLAVGADEDLRSRCSRYFPTQLQQGVDLADLLVD